MKCQSLFSMKNKRNVIYVLSAEFAHRDVKVNKVSQITFIEEHMFQIKKKYTRKTPKSQPYLVFQSYLLRKLNIPIH